MSLVEVTPAAISRRSGDYGLSIREAAQRANVSPRTVWRLIRAGHLRALRVSERRRIIMASELTRHLSEGVAA